MLYYVEEVVAYYVQFVYSIIFVEQPRALNQVMLSIRRSVQNSCFSRLKSCTSIFEMGPFGEFCKERRSSLQSLGRSRLPRGQVLEQQGGLERNEACHEEEDDHGCDFVILRETTAAALLV